MTATSSAAFSTHGAVPPARAGVVRQAQAREVVVVGPLERQLPQLGEVERRDGHVRPLGVVEGVGDRYPHVREAEVGEARAVVQVDQRVDERLRVDEHVDVGRSGMPNRCIASITSKPLFISVAQSIVMRPPMSQVGWFSASSGVTSISSSRVRPLKGPPEAVRTSLSTVPGFSLDDQLVER